MSSIKDPLRELLDSLDAISDKHAEIADTFVREQLHIAIFQGFIFGTDGYTVDSKLGMSSTDGNDAARAALEQFISACRSTAFNTKEERLAAFQDLRVQSTRGSTYDDYFGYVEF